MSNLDEFVDLAHTLMHDGYEWLSQYSTVARLNGWYGVMIPIADSIGDWFSFYFRECNHMIELDDGGEVLASKELSAGDVSRVEERFGVDIHDGIVKKRVARHDGEGFVLFVQALVVLDTLAPAEQ